MQRLILAVASLVSAAPPAPLSSADPPAQAGTVCPIKSSDWLSMLPDGLEKREFILDCTGCHLFDAERTLHNGVLRTEPEWTDAITRMLGFAGATTSFPVISAARDPVRTAAWLARHLRAAPRGGTCPPKLLDGATITEFSLPEPRDLPHDLAVDTAGRVIVTGMFTHVMYVLDPETGRFTEIPIPVPRANPRAVEIDSAGTWWVALGAPHRLARYDPPSGSWTTYDIGVYPHSLAPDHRSRVWFNGHFTRDPELIGTVDVASGTVATLAVPPHPTLAAGPGGPIPHEIRVAPDGRVWLTELQGNRLVESLPDTRAFVVHEMPLPASGPRRFDIDREGIVWIPAYSANAIVRYDPGTGRFESFPLPLRDAVPYVVRAEPGTGLAWICTAAGDVLLSFDPSTWRFTVFPLPRVGALVRHLAIDPRTHDVWVAYGASPGIPARIARLRVAAERR